jgi:hypothetical protein
MINTSEGGSDARPGLAELTLPEPRRRMSVSIIIGLAIALFGIGFAVGRLLLPSLLP